MEGPTLRQVIDGTATVADYLGLTDDERQLVQELDTVDFPEGGLPDLEQDLERLSLNGRRLG